MSSTLESRVQVELHNRDTRLIIEFRLSLTYHQINYLNIPHARVLASTMLESGSSDFI